MTLVGVLMVESSPRRTVLGPVLSDALITLVVFTVFLVVFQGWRQRAVALTTAAMATAVSWSRYLSIMSEHEALRPVLHHGLMIAFLGFAVSVILRHIFTRESVTGDEVLGAASGYLLAAAMWANAYALMEILVPGSFTVSPELTESLGTRLGRTAVFNYFSLVTLTTMGYGDITPVRPPATAFAMLEAVFGQFYIAVVVAQLVGLRLAQAFARRDPPSR